MISVRPTVFQDAPILHAIQKQAFLPLYERYHDAGNPYLRGMDDVTRRIDSPFFRAFTVLEDGDIVGSIFYRVQGSCPFLGDLKPGEYYLSRAYIRPDRQGQKIAQRAILLCEKHFPDAKLFAVDFPADLEKNRRCYEAAGYRETGLRHEVQPGLTLACLKKHCQSPQ